MTKKVTFSIIGGSGYRAQYYFRIAQALPDLLHISGVVVRNQEKGELIEKKWNVTTYRSLDNLLEKESPDFVVVSVSRSACPSYLVRLAKLNIPTLTETPPASGMDELNMLYDQLPNKGANIQVAEQYQFQPMHQARLRIINDGRLGNVTEATISISHFYHGVSLIRKMLNVGFEEACIRGRRFNSTVVAGPSRAGYPTEEKVITVARDMAWIDFGGKLGVYDFTKDQHRSWIRSNHILVRGERGEIFDNKLHYLADYQTPIHIDLKRINKGEHENQEGHFLDGILAGDKWMYKNPFAPARLYDDEIAIATCLQKMADFCQGGPSFYSLSEASQDYYLGLMIENSIRFDQTVIARKKTWAEK